MKGSGEFSDYNNRKINLWEDFKSALSKHVNLTSVWGSSNMRTPHEIVLIDTFSIAVDCIGGSKKGHINLQHHVCFSSCDVLKGRDNVWSWAMINLWALGKEFWLKWSEIWIASSWNSLRSIWRIVASNEGLNRQSHGEWVSQVNGREEWEGKFSCGQRHALISITMFQKSFIP